MNTTAQLDHLRAIDAHLDRLLTIAAKRTPGEWKADFSVSFNHIVTEAEAAKPLRLRRAIATTTKMYSPDYAAADVDFIASCANNAEAGWRSTKALIGIIIQDTWAQNADELTETILKQWPLKTLKP